MSNATSIDAVTRTLRHLLEDRFRLAGPASATVTTKPLDKARDSSNRGGDQVNLFLYHVSESGAWKNTPMPAAPGAGHPPLGLILRYLVTVYAQNDDFPDPISHRLLAEAMLLFHDHAVLSPDDIKASLPGNELGEYDLYNQVERVRLTLRSLTEDELNKIWTAFQVPFRLTFVCEASVVLLESRRAAIVASPVLTRGGPSDRGVDVLASVGSPVPSLSAIQFRQLEAARQKLSPLQAQLLKQAAAQIGEKLTLLGERLGEGDVRVLFRHPQLEQEIEIKTLEGRSDTSLALSLPSSGAGWLAGLYTVAVELKVKPGASDQRLWRTNGLPLALAPALVGPITAARDPANADVVVLTLTCDPPVAPQQQVSLIFTVLEAKALALPKQPLDVSLEQLSDRELLAAPRTKQESSLTFRLDRECLSRAGIPMDGYNDKRIQGGTYQLRPRLRVDGIESAVVKDQTKSPAQFIDPQPLVIAP